MTRLDTAPRRTLRSLGGLGLTALVLAGCAAGTGTGAGSASAPDSTADAAQTEDGPRVAVAYAGGVLIVDGETLEVIDDLPSEEFVRLNPAGDDRHVLVSTSAGFQFLDARAAELTDLVVAADAAGHVVRHAGKTVLYDDATSDTTIFDTGDLGAIDGALPDAELIEGVEAHHGVSVVLEDGSFVTTVGSSAGRSGIRVVDADGAEIAASDDCPGVHGEGTAADETVVFGCEDGVLVYADGEITKAVSPDEYGRVGNAYATDASPIVLMDYKDDPDAEGSLLSNVAVVDTVAGTLTKVALPNGVQYTWRGVVRTAADQALMIGTDGRLHVLDPTTGAITASFEAISPWEGPAQWQDEHPALAVSGDVAYVTDSASSEIVAIDIATGQTIATGALPEIPNEIVAVG